MHMLDRPIAFEPEESAAWVPPSGNLNLVDLRSKKELAVEEIQIAIQQIDDFETECRRRGVDPDVFA